MLFIPTKMSGIRALIVEDNPFVAKSIENYLKRLRYKTVDIVDNGLAAINNAKEFNPDLILMDINLNGNQNGIETSKKICNDLNVPIIFITEHREETIFREAIETCPFGFIYKPISFEKLKISIETALNMYFVRKLNQNKSNLQSFLMNQLFPHTG
jgi:DNA-binding NarL/FixJ family response regulator